MKKLFDILTKIIPGIILLAFWLGIPLLFFDPEDEGFLNTLCGLWILAPAIYVALWIWYKEEHKRQKEKSFQRFKEKHIKKKIN